MTYNVSRLDPVCVIRSFRCKKTQAFYEGGKIDKQWRTLQDVVERKLQMLDAAHLLKDLVVPPGNRLEARKGNRKGQHSIRLNEQFRICFVWTLNGPSDVEIVDDH